MRIGAHIPSTDPLGAARARGADCVQFFLSNPQSWRKPAPRDDAEQLRAAGLPIYVHAPYLVNVATGNNKVRVPSRRILQETCDAAEAIGAAAVIVHGGHVDEGTPLDEGFENWRKALERIETDVPILIENTAGGQRAMARHVETIARLWEALDGFDVGFCFDTCHAHAAGEDPRDVVSRVRDAVGAIELVHANDSKDVLGCGRDRHQNLGAGTIGEERLIEMIRACEAPVICETPGEAEAHAGDIAWLRARLPVPAGDS